MTELEDIKRIIRREIGYRAPDDAQLFLEEMFEALGVAYDEVVNGKQEDPHQQLLFQEKGGDSISLQDDLRAFAEGA